MWGQLSILLRNLAGYRSSQDKGHLHLCPWESSSLPNRSTQIYVSLMAGASLFLLINTVDQAQKERKAAVCAFAADHVLLLSPIYVLQSLSSTCLFHPLSYLTSTHHCMARWDTHLLQSGILCHASAHTMASAQNCLYIGDLSLHTIREHFNGASVMCRALSCKWSAMSVKQDQSLNLDYN